ncbi:MAG: EAL domain-containing protein [Sulfuricaulis sp.]|uniref:putative bifunctional diguanylate cyclase/phosphodiesterase n=1 Tax=Sulfuricaulis sp. TaxID=2003553 RepID=UPI0025D80EE4|nr:EAL domain-containing protein [Sulfuricaulis sp.]MCR4347127.1 EAL domain-containing protein [Sulfuricaulis sp.]
MRKLYKRVRRLVERSLASRLLFLLMAGSVGVYLIVNVGLWWTASDLIDDNLEKQAVRWLTELDELGTPLYASYGGKHFSNIDKRIKNFPEIAFIRYYDATGKKIMGEFGNKQGKEVPPLEPRQIAALNQMSGMERVYLVDRSLLADSFLRFITPIRVRSMHSDGLLNFSLESEKPENVKIIGYLDLSIDSAYYKGQLVRSMASGSLIIAGLLLLGMLCGSWIIRKALAPLTALKIPLARLAQGETDVVVERPKDAEIAAISDALNTTIKAIKVRDAALRKMAERDPLTDLVNRGIFRRELEREIEQVSHDALPSAVFFIDLDQFKYVNDTMGHPAGDKLLIRVAELLKSQARDKDVVSRFGGDEFTVLARNVSREDAMEMARSINQVMRDMCLVEGDKVLSVNCSIGVAMIEPGRYSAEEVMAHADMACFEAKSHGRNRMHMYEEGGDSKKEMVMDIGWFQHIKQIIEQNRFLLMYQPIADVMYPDKESYEVLLRMPGPNNEIVLPSVFLPVAERFGLMADIDRWVVIHALKALADFRASGRDVIFSINLSGQSLEDATLLQMIKNHLAQNGLPPRSVIFEITEQSAMRYLDKARLLIQGLTDFGCRFALDNFGTGFSSYSYLQQLPVNFIKIDGSFVRNMTRSPIDETMVLSIIQIARSLGKLTVAGSVQDEKTSAMLKASGVDHLQGNYVGEPAEKLPVTLRVVPSVKKNMG